MSSEVSNLLDVAIGSAEASIAVLLVLGFGYYAQYARWINEEGEQASLNQITQLCVTVFLPALLFTQIGPHATPHNLTDYGIIVVLSIFAMLVSYLVGIASRRALKSPRWTVAAFVFNNATSLPLLLLNSLEKTGTIEIIIGKDGGSVEDAVARGQTYLLIAALVGNLGRFALGPDIMGSKQNNDTDFPGDLSTTFRPVITESESTPLLSTERIHNTASRTWPVIKDTAKRTWAWVADAINPPLIAAIVAIVFGLIPPLHHAFFEKGEPLNATVTQSVNYLGKLYTALQIFVLGSKLRSKAGDKLPILSTTILFIHRFIVMPAIMISVVYFLRSTWPNYVEQDPVLDFVSSIVGIGPPAITLSAIAEMAELDSREDAQVSRMLMLSYLVTPFICSIYLPESGLAYRVAAALVGRPLWWALQQTGLVGDDVIRETWGDFVIVANAEAAAKKVIDAQRAKGGIGPASALYTFASFRHTFASLVAQHPGAELSETDARVLVKHLERDRSCVVVDRQAGVIKFVEEGSFEREGITSVDKGILEMSVTSVKLQEQVDEIQKRIEERAEKINILLRKKQKELALSMLRSRKELEALLKLRLGALETVQTSLMKIETAAGDIAIMKAYETSTATLKQLLADPRLQREHIDQTMESMADALADHKEVEEAIALGGVPSDPAEDDELARELQQLVDENEREAQEQELERKREEKTIADLEKLTVHTPQPVADKEQEEQPALVEAYIYAFAYWVGGRQVPALDKAKLERKQVNGAGNGHTDDTPAIPKHRDTDNAPGTTMLLTLPSSSRMLRRISFAFNSILMFMVMEYVSKPHFQPVHDLQFARVGAVDSTSAKIVVRYPAPPEPSTSATSTTTSAPSPTPSIIEAIQDAVDGLLPEITLPEIALPEIALPAAVEDMLTSTPTPRTTSLRVQWRNAGLSSSALDNRLVELDGTLWSSPESTLSFRTTPDSRLARGSHFRFVSTSCVIPNFPYSVFAEGTHIRGFDLLADHIWPAEPQVKDTPSKAQEEPVAAPVAEEIPELVSTHEAPEPTTPPTATDDVTPLHLDDKQAPLTSTEASPAVPARPAPIEFLMMMGDFIYADVPYYFGDTIQAYRRLYRRVYASKSFRKIYERLPTYNIYDDHEFINNFGANGNDSNAPYLNASRAYEIYNGQANPDAKEKGVYYYDFRHGDTAFFVMDTRRYRSPPPPPKPYPFPISLFAPLIHAVAAGRNPFAAYFGEPNAPSNPIAEAVDEASRTMLGEDQLAALHSWVADVNRTATWKFVVSSVPLTAMWAGYDGHVDLWAGYMHERDTVLSLLSSVPNVIVLSGDRHEFAAVEFPRGKHLVREYSTSPLNQFYVPWANTLSPTNARNITLIRKNVITTETGEEHIEEVAEEVEEEVLVKYHPSGNHKWTTIEVDSMDSNAPTLKVELYVNGNLEWEQKVFGEPVELTHPTSLVIPAQVQGVVESLKKSLKGWFRSY
ncbi:unnamed protein product [Rhizoctonia solani]|uniref:PhoD-like phosphatase metallophosphatase domain-containing protein n=1 Tax=Rhizoctonia solani TaxID=456999 RepID=A0A8H3CN47_9AGAM|nr:unnamed protein product [Rhizoctonia solani]